MSNTLLLFLGVLLAVPADSTPPGWRPPTAAALERLRASYQTARAARSRRDSLANLAYRSDTIRIGGLIVVTERRLRGRVEPAVRASWDRLAPQ